MAFRAQFFDQRVVDMVGKKAARALRRFGAYVRVVARNSLKQARRKRDSELTDDERKYFKASVAIARHKGAPRPKRPFMPSGPGELPRIRKVARYGNKSPLKNLILYEYDHQKKSVVIGPAIFQSSARTKGIGALEHGGTVRTKRGSVRIESRPFMAPAFDKSISIGKILEGFKQ